MPVDPQLLALLRCPESRQPLSEASRHLVEQVNCEGWMREGEPLLTEALVRADGQLLFPVRDDIPILLMEQAVRIPPAG